MLTKEELPECPVATTVQLVGSKWKLLILRNLLARPWRFNELRKDLEGISQKVLTDSLRSLEEDGIVQRKVYPQVPPRVEYTKPAWNRGRPPTRRKDSAGRPGKGAPLFLFPLDSAWEMRYDAPQEKPPFCPKFSGF